MNVSQLFAGKKHEVEYVAVAALLILEFLLIVSFLMLSSPSNVNAEQVGMNATVTTFLQIGNVYPEVINVSIMYGAASFDLQANTTKNITIFAIARDWNGEEDVINASVRFFDNVASAYGNADDNNNHYSANCSLDAAYGSIYEVNVTCIIPMWYYSNNASWNATVNVTDNSSWTGWGSDMITINQLLAVGLPDSIDYGIVNATQVSAEKIANVTNYGNVRINLSLSGYARTVGDNLAMNCSLGSNPNISIYYERYNLNLSNDTFPLSYSEFVLAYKNLTSNPIVRPFGLNYRQDDAVNDAINGTYWRMYVPVGPAGTCRGNIVFGASIATGNWSA